MPKSLVHLNTNAASWARRLAGALAAAAPSSDGVYLYCTGGWAEEPLSASAVGALSEAFDCVPSNSPMLDVVPLLPAAGWTPPQQPMMGQVQVQQPMMGQGQVQVQQPMMRQGQVQMQQP